MNNIATQNGSIQIKMNKYYTATCRNINDLERMLNDANESKESLEILSVYNVSKEFEAAVRAMIENFLNPNERTIEVECVSYYRDGSTKRTTTETVIIRKDNKIKFDGDCMGSYSFRFQKVKSTSFGDYINVYGERMYFAWDAPKFKNQ